MIATKTPLIQKMSLRCALLGAMACLLLTGVATKSQAQGERLAAAARLGILEEGVPPAGWATNDDRYFNSAPRCEARCGPEFCSSETCGCFDASPEFGHNGNQKGPLQWLLPGCVANMAFGPVVKIPTTEVPDLIEPGVGMRIATELKPLKIHCSACRPFVYTPIIDIDLVGFDDDDHVQLNGTGIPSSKIGGVFEAALRVGLRERAPVNDGLNLFVEGGFSLFYTTTNIREEPQNLNEAQLVATRLTDYDWAPGYFAGGGAEFALGHGAMRVRAGVEGRSTDVFTGISRDTTMATISVELVGNVLGGCW